MFVWLLLQIMNSNADGAGYGGYCAEGSIRHHTKRTQDKDEEILRRVERMIESSRTAVADNGGKEIPVSRKNNGDIV